MKSGTSETSFYVHEELLKKSSPVLFSMCERKWVETQERLYRFDRAVSDQVISCFLSYAYNGDYVYCAPKTDSITSPPVDPGSKNGSVINDEETTTVKNGEDDKYKLAPSHVQNAHPLLLHVQLYVFADTYIIPDLQKLARGKIRDWLQKCPSLNPEGVREMIFDLMEYAFENLREEDIMLTFLSLYASNKLDALRLSSQRLEALMLGSDGKFVRLFIQKINPSTRDAFSFTDESLAEVTLNEGVHNSEN